MTINVLALTHESINTNALVHSMKVYVDLGQFWPEGLSINAAYEDLIMKGMKVDRRTLSAAKSGTLIKSEYTTLIRLRDWVRNITKNPKLSIEDLLRIEA